VRLHAQGGLGEVFVAQDTVLHRDVALKRMQARLQGDAGSRQRFLREAEITGRLEHPGIVPVYDLQHDADGRPCYAMRFVEGETLKQACERYHAAPTRLAFRQLLQHFIAACNAVAYAHSRGVLHRDLKPSNILLGKFGETLVVDWGLAKVAGRTEATRTDEAEGTLTTEYQPTGEGTAMGQAVGTLPYMSPEQEAGRWNVVGPASDVYGLGATLYHVLTGRAPFRGTDVHEMRARVQRGDFPPPRQVCREVPKALDAICRKAMALEPEQRYATATELAGDVEHWLADEAVLAYGEPWLARAGRWARQHRTLVTTTAAVLLVATVGSTAAALLLAHANTKLEAARQEAVTNERTASARAAETRAVLDFVENRVFAAARPEGMEGGLGSKVTLREAIERAVPFVEGSFPEQPFVEAGLRETLGISFLYLGDAKAALAQFQTVRALLTEYVGPHHPATLKSMHDLALSYSALGKHPDALKLHEEALALQKAMLGPDDPETLKGMLNLASSYWGLGRFEDAFKLQDETLALMKAKLGPDHPDTLSCMANFANSYSMLNREAEALKLREDTLALEKAKLGPDHPTTLRGMNNLAASYAHLGRRVQALKLREETLALMRAKFAPDHPDTLRSMANLAESYRELGRYADALKLHEETLALRKVRLGLDHRDTLASMFNLALTYTDLGRYADALKLHEETLALRKAKLGAKDPETLSSMVALANSYHDLGRHTEALKLREETLPLLKATLPFDDPNTLWGMHNLARSYAHFGRHGEALKLFEDTLAIMRAKFGADHPSTLLCMTNLASTYGDLGRHADALKLDEETLALKKAKLGADHPDTLLSMNNVADSLTTLGRHAEALQLIERAVALLKAKLGMDHPETLLSMSTQAEILVKLHRSAEAVPIIDEFVKRAAHAPADSDIISTGMDLRLRHFVEAKDVAGCRATAEMWESLKRTDADSLYRAADMRAVTAGVLRATDPSDAAVKTAAAEAERAMAWLRQAVAAGYKDVARVKKDKDLDALRKREDFKKLLADLEGKASEPKK
jgi:tetratricopeptide (TPR) repeat protein